MLGLCRCAIRPAVTRHTVQDGYSRQPWAVAVGTCRRRGGRQLLRFHGEFSTPIYKARAKLHPSVNLELRYLADSREECYEPEFDELHAFYLKMLTLAARSTARLNKL